MYLIFGGKCWGLSALPLHLQCAVLCGSLSWGRVISVPVVTGSPLPDKQDVWAGFSFSDQVSTSKAFKRLVLWCFLHFLRHALESNFCFLRQSKLLINWQGYLTRCHDFGLHLSSVRGVLNVYWSLALLFIAFKKNSLRVPWFHTKDSWNSSTFSDHKSESLGETECAAWNCVPAEDVFRP